MSDERFEIDFRTDHPTLEENVVTLGAASVVRAGVDAVLGDSHGWYCTITDKLTGLKESVWGSTKAEAQENAFRELNESIQKFEREKEREERRALERKIEEEQKATHERELRANEREQESGNNGTEWLVKIAVVLVAVVVAIWLVFAVVVPFILSNAGIVLLIAAFIVAKWRKWLYPAAVIGALYVIADFQMGWMTKTLIENVGFLSSVVPILVYLNVAAGGVAGYLGFKLWKAEKSKLA